MYKHQDADSSFVELHDCRAERIVFDNGVLSFIFPEGFWISPGNPANGSAEYIRTDSAQADFTLIGSMQAYVYKIKRTGKIEGKVYWNLEDFIKAVNDGDYILEFLYSYSSGSSVLYKCTVQSEGKTYDCEIILDVESVLYRWNALNYSRVM